MPNLFQINEAIEEIISRIDPETGELTDELAQMLDEVSIEKERKIESIALKIRERKAFAETAKREADRLNAISKSSLREVEGMEAYLEHCMAIDEKVKTPLVSVSRRRSESVEIQEGFNLSCISQLDGLVSTVSVTKPNKVAIKEYLIGQGTDRIVDENGNFIRISVNYNVQVR